MSNWPVVLQHGLIRLRPLRQRDGRSWIAVRKRSASWLQPWDATLPAAAAMHAEISPTFGAMVRRSRAEAKAGRTLPWALEYDGSFVGQVTVGGIAMGSLRGAYIGYWIDADHVGKGIVPTAVAMACDYLINELGLHRIELNIRPENQASLRVAEKLKFTREGLRPKYLHIDGQWRDHITYVLFEGDQPGGVLAGYLATQ